MDCEKHYIVIVIASMVYQFIISRDFNIFKHVYIGYLDEAITVSLFAKSKNVLLPFIFVRFKIHVPLQNYVLQKIKG